MVAANRDYLADWMPWAAEQTLERTEGYLRSARREAEEDNSFQAVILRDDRVIGMAGFHNIEWEAETTTLGYCNTKSRAIRARLGLEREGILREAEKVNGVYQDLVLYAKLAPGRVRSGEPAQSSTS